MIPVAVKNLYACLALLILHIVEIAEIFLIYNHVHTNKKWNWSLVEIDMINFSLKTKIGRYVYIDICVKWQIKLNDQLKLSNEK